MSNYLAVATVTSALQSLLDKAARHAVHGAGATTVSPDKLGERTSPEAGVNIFLFMVRPNAALSNADLPRLVGDKFTRPPQVALDLDYVLTFFGKDEQLEPQRILGAVVSTLHADPVLTPERIRRLVDDPPHGRTFLKGSNLADQEPVRIERVVLPTDELHRLWALFSETSYLLSTVYRASVVLIDADVSLVSTLPVASVQPSAMAGLPLVNSASAAVAVGDVIELRGVFPARPSLIVLDGRAVTVPPDAPWLEVRPGVILVTLTEELATSARLVPGPGVSLALEFGVRGREARSAPVELTLLPTIDGAPRADRSHLKVTVTPAVAAASRVQAYLDAAPPSAGASAVLSRGPSAGRSAHLQFPLRDVPPGRYLVRVVVDGAQSRLQMRDGVFSGPTVEVEP